MSTRTDKRPGDAQANYVRASVPIVLISIALGAILLATESARDIILLRSKLLSDAAGPTFVDQIVSNGVVLLSVIVTSVLVILTYSLFHQTRETLRIAQAQIQAGAAQAAAATAQAQSAEESLLELRRQIDFQAAAERRAINAFVDISSNRIVSNPDRRRVYDIAAKDELGRPTQLVFAGYYASDPRENPFSLLRDRHLDALFTVDTFTFESPLRNNGSGPALDVVVKVEDICWSTVRLKIAENMLLPPLKIIFDCLGHGAIGKVNYSTFSREYRNLMLLPRDEWAVKHSVAFRDSQLTPASYLERNIDDVVAALDFDSDLLFGNLLGKNVTIRPDYGSVEYDELPTGLPKGELKEHLRRQYQLQRSMPNGVRLTISYSSLWSESQRQASAALLEKTRRDVVIYNLLFEETAPPGEESLLKLTPILEHVHNDILGFTKTTTLGSRINAGEDDRLKVKAGRALTYGDRCFRFAGVEEELLATRYIEELSETLAEILPRTPELKELLADNLRKAKADDLPSRLLQFGASPTIAFGVDEMALTHMVDKVIESC